LALAVFLVACLLAALAYLAWRARLQAVQIRRIALERLRLETEVALQSRELQESNRALEEALRRVDALLVEQRDAVSATADVETAENDPADMAQPAAAPAEDQIWSDMDTAAVGRLRNLRYSGPSDLYGRLVELFESGSERALVELRTALERGRFEEAATISHKFASSAANVGALTFAQSVRELERLCRAGDAGHSLGLYLRLRTAHPRLMVILQGHRLQASA
jgi:HPt (histidine-containing phosphotransfer) domain-containing protein